MKLKFLLLLLLFLLVSCNSLNTLLGDSSQQNEEKIAENLTLAVEVNITNTTEVEVKEPINTFIPRYGNLTVYFLDIKGDSVLIHKNNNSVLIDSGYKEDSEKIIKDIKNLGIEKLNIIIATNTNSKNIGGLPYTLMKTNPDMIIDNGIPSNSVSYKLYKELYGNSTTIEIERDRLFAFDDFIINVIAPYDDGEGFNLDLNQNSLVSKVQYGNIEFLFMSNCEILCEDRIKDVNLNADVLKVANGGSCDSTSLSFLKKVSPDFAVVSGDVEICPDIIERFKFLNIPLLSTKEKGDIFFTTDGARISYGVIS